MREVSIRQSGVVARAFTVNKSLGGSVIPRNSVSLLLRESSSAVDLTVFFGHRATVICLRRRRVSPRKSEKRPNVSDFVSVFPPIRVVSKTMDLGPIGPFHNSGPSFSLLSAVFQKQ